MSLHTLLCWVLSIFCICGAFQGNCSFSFLVTQKIFVDQRPLIIQTGTSLSLQIQPPLFLFQSVTGRFSGYDRKYKPDYQMTHPVVSPFRTATPFVLTGQGLGLTQRGKIKLISPWKSHAVHGMCLHCSQPAPNRIKRFF